MPDGFQASPWYRWLAVTPRRIEFVIPGSSPGQAPRTASSLPLAPHPASQRRSYLQLRGHGLPRNGLTPSCLRAFTGARHPKAPLLGSPVDRLVGPHFQIDFANPTALVMAVSTNRPTHASLVTWVRLPAAAWPQPDGSGGQTRSRLSSSRSFVFHRSGLRRGGRLGFMSLIVGPHTQDANRFLFGKNFIDHAVLNIDASRVGASKITNQLFEGRRILKRIMGKNRQQF